MKTKNSNRHATWLLTMTAFLLQACSSGDSVPFPPFTEDQFGTASLQVEVLDPSLYAPVSILVLKPKDTRTTDYVYLEDFWLNPSRLGIRRGQPYKIETWLRDEVHGVLGQIPQLTALTAEEFKKRGNKADLALQVAVLEAEVAHYPPTSFYRCTVVMEFALLDAQAKPLWEEPFRISVAEKKSFTLEGLQHSPISPLVEETVSLALQQLVRHEPFLIALRTASRGRR